ncbi:MAG: DNA/RNA nuclease SfsA [Waddliaceae bacterium]|nr:DNA/RNA nuclease SfsA [Waddliaceae bacterium]
MKYSSPLISGTFIKRYKRFFADIQLESGEIVTAHCANSGRMTSCIHEGWPVLISYDPNPKRKLSYNLELIHNGSCWICVHTHRANKIVAEALENKQISSLEPSIEIRPEVRVGDSRLDFQVTQADGSLCFVEVKSVTFLSEEACYRFPDAVSTRAQKHLESLMKLVDEGYRAVIFFLIQRSDGEILAPADHVDPKYGSLLRQAVQHGVEVLAYETNIDESSIELGREVSICLDL